MPKRRQDDGTVWRDGRYDSALDGMMDKTYGRMKRWYDVADGSTPARSMGWRDDGMKHSMGQDYGGCTRPRLQRQGIGTVVAEGNVFGQILSYRCIANVPQQHTKLPMSHRYCTRLAMWHQHCTRLPMLMSHCQSKPLYGFHCWDCPSEKAFLEISPKFLFKWCGTLF